MAIAYDNVSPDTSTAAGATNLTSGAWTIAGTDRALFGFIATAAGGGGAAHSSMAWGGSGGTALTQIGSTLSVGSPGRLSAWRLVAPTAASQTLYGSWAASQDECAIGGVSYTGVDQTTPVGTPATNTGAFAGVTSGTASVTIATTAGDLVVAAFWVVAQSAADPLVTPSGTPTPTGRYEIEGTQITYEALQVQEVVATGTSTTLSCDFSSGLSFSGDWGALAFVVNAAAASGNTVTPGAGSLTLAGLAPSVLDMPRAPAAGALVLGGQEPQLATPIIAVGWNDPIDTWSYVGGRALVGGTQPSYVFGITPDHGVLTLAGTIPTVIVAAGGGGVTATPDAGALTLAGLAPAITQDIILQPGAGALVLAGLAPAAVQDSNRQPGAGALTLGGLAPSLLTNYAPAPGAGTLVLEGLSPSLLVATIAQPGIGTLALDGLAPSLLVAQAVNPDAGVLTLTGLAPSLLTAFVVQPGAGALVLDGQQPAVLNGDSRVAQPPAGTLVLDGLTPAVTATDNHAAAPDTGVLVLDGHAPSVLSGFTVAPSSGALVLAGLTPSVTATDNRTVAPETGALVLTGSAPAAAVSDNQVVQPATGVLVFAGEAPTIPVQSPNVTPDPGALTLEGLAPTVDSGAGNSLLSAKYLGYPNVVVRGLKAGGKAEPEDPLPADITNIPDAPPPPKPRARGLAILGSLVAPEPQPVEAPQVKAPTIKAPPRAAEPPAPAAEPAPAVAEPPAAAPAPRPPSPVAQVAKTVESVQAAVQVQNEYLIEQFTALNARIAELQDALAANIAKVEETRVRRERNQRRAEEITRKLLMNGD